MPVGAPSEDEISEILALKDKCQKRMGIAIVLGEDFLQSLDKAGVGAFAFMKGKAFRRIRFLLFVREGGGGSIGFRRS